MEAIEELILHWLHLYHQHSEWQGPYLSPQQCLTGNYMSTSGSFNALCWGFKGVEGMATYNVTLIEDRKL